MKKTIAALLFAFAASSAAPAFAAESMAYPAAPHKMKHCGHKGQCKHSMPGHNMAMKPAIAMEKLPASVQAYIKANDKMHREMMMNYSGNADVDFVRGMIAHHKGAIAMSEVELKYGKDAENRALAKNIIAAQKQEIHQMEKWLKNKRHEMKAEAKVEKTEAKAGHKAAKKHAKMKVHAAKK